MLNKWMENLVKISKGDSSFTCPYCGSSDIEYAYVLHDETHNMGTLDVWCDKCKRAYHVSRIRVDDKKIGKVPEGLHY